MARRNLSKRRTMKRRTMKRRNMKRRNMKRRTMKSKKLTKLHKGGGNVVINIAVGEQGYVSSSWRNFMHGWNNVYYTRVDGQEPYPFDAHPSRDHWARAFDGVLGYIKDTNPIEATTFTINFIKPDDSIIYSYILNYEVGVGIYRTVDVGRAYLVKKTDEFRWMCQDGTAATSEAIGTYDKVTPASN